MPEFIEIERVDRPVDVGLMLIGANDRLLIPNTVPAAYDQVERPIEVDQRRRLRRYSLGHVQDRS